jgi:hypothetical protein
MSLLDLLDTIDTALGPKGSDGRRRAVEDLIKAEEQRRILKVGDQAPLFSLPHADKGLVSSAELLRQGPLVIGFYRGLWCPYCQRDLIGLEIAMPEIKATVAYFMTGKSSAFRSWTMRPAMSLSNSASAGTWPILA